MTCDHTLAGGPLVCVRNDTHDRRATGGHVYESAWCADPLHADETSDQ